VRYPENWKSIERVIDFGGDAGTEGSF